MTAQTILPANSAASGGYDVANSCRFDDGSSDHMHKTLGSAGSRIKWTFSVWVKRGALGAMPILAVPGGDTNNYDEFYFNGSDKIQYSAMVSGTQYALRTKRVFKDISAWYHIVLIFDSNSSTAGDRMQLWINGVRTAEGDFEDITFKDAQNYSSSINNDKIHYLGKVTTNTAAIFDGYMTEVVFQNNSADSPVDKFGEFDEDSGIWKPIKVSGLTLGTNGFYLDFEDSSNLGNDVGGGTDLTEVNIDATNQSTDTCTNNFATLNSIDTFYVDGTLSEGNCKYVGSAGNYDFVYSTIQVSQGKWYFEGTYKDGNDDNGLIGITGKAMTDTANYLGKTATHEFSYIGNAGRTVTGGSFSTSGSYDAFTADDVIGVAMDLDNNKLYYSKNGTFQNSGDPTSGATGTGALAITAAASTTNGSYAFAVSSFDSDDADEWEVNFGNPVAALSSAATDGNGFGSFEYAPPSGYLALCTKNLATDG